MKTKKALMKALKALKSFREISELENGSELSHEIIRLTDWQAIAEAINNMEETVDNIEIEN